MKYFKDSELTSVYKEFDEFINRDGYVKYGKNGRTPSELIREICKNMPDDMLEEVVSLAREYYQESSNPSP